MPTQEVEMLQQIIDTGITGALIIISLTMLIFGISAFMFMRYLIKKQQTDAEVLNEVKRSNKNTEGAIDELKAHRKSLESVADTAIRIEGRVDTVAKDTYRSAENSAASLKDIRDLKQQVIGLEQTMVRLLNANENQAIKRQTEVLAEIDEANKNITGLSGKLSDVKLHFDTPLETMQTDLRSIIRYIKPATGELPSTGTLPAEPKADSDTGELPQSA